MIVYSTAKSPEDLQQIMALQAQNLPQAVPAQEAATQGFVTVQHDLDLLAAMNEKYPHQLALAEGRVVGFALVMLPEFGDKIPVLVPMFRLLDQLEYRGTPLREQAYFVMGQVCIDKAYRGQGIFRELYEKLRRDMAPHFSLLVTEIATRNTRSLQAHAALGFRHLHRYTADGEEWDIVTWDLR